MNPTLLISREIYEKYGEYDQELCGFDYEIHLRWAAQGLQFAYVPEIWAAFRIHKDQRTGISRYTQNGAQAFEYCSILERYLAPEHTPKIRFLKKVSNGNYSATKPCTPRRLYRYGHSAKHRKPFDQYVRRDPGNECPHGVSA